MGRLRGRRTVCVSVNHMDQWSVSSVRLSPSSLGWRCCIWSSVKERGCRAQTPTVNSWTTIDGKTPTLLLFVIYSSAPKKIITSSSPFLPSHPIPGLSWCFQWRGSCSTSPPRPSLLPSSPLPTCSPSSLATSTARGWSCYRTSYSELRPRTWR